MKTSFTSTLGHRSLTFASALFTAGLLAVALTNPNAWLQSGFEAAINGSGTPSQVTAAQSKWTQPVAGSEAYWLGSNPTAPNHDLIQPAHWRSSIAQGDRFSISSHGKQREFEVIAIEPLLNSTGQQHRRADDVLKNQLIVVCRTTDTDHPETLRFLMDADAPLPWTVVEAGKGHAL